MRRIVSEFLGTLILVVAVLGPAFMASNLGVSPGFALVMAALVLTSIPRCHLPFCCRGA
jgi:glycerol uptake facilitator-like aquaporin